VKKQAPASLPVMMMELAFASWETIGRRTLMMARGTCSAAEYSRMMQEKMAASERSAAVLMRSGPVTDWAALMAPWHARATSNARRLRGK
jgi:hypothetical protein